MSETILEKAASPTLERRRRLRRPTPLVAFAVLFLLLPLLNYVAISLNRATLTDPLAFAATLSPVGRALWLVPPIVALGLLWVSRWGWWLFLAYAPTLALYNLVGFSRNPTPFNLAAVAQTLVAFAAMAYFLRRDVYAPYLSSVRRGWRHAPRVPLVAPVAIDGVQYKTVNVSDRGCYVEWSGYSGAIGDSLSLQLTLGGDAFSLEAGAVRIDRAAVGVAFRNLDRATTDRLRSAIERAKAEAARA